MSIAEISAVDSTYRVIPAVTAFASSVSYNSTSMVGPLYVIDDNGYGDSDRGMWQSADGKC